MIHVVFLSNILLLTYLKQCCTTEDDNAYGNEYDKESVLGSGKKFIMNAEKKRKHSKFKSSLKFTTSEKLEGEETLQEKCRKRYKNSYKKYSSYFLKCLEEIEDLQPSGFACIQASRYFTLGVLPKYCSIPDPLTRKERDRVERLLAD